MASSARLADIFPGGTVLVTGHTGFKGSWLCEWLLLLGAKVTGYSLEAPTQPSLFEQLALKDRITHVHGDVRNAGALAACVREVRPDFIFHFAAQSLVRQSYREPVETYATNVMGTVNLLDAVRLAARPCIVICATTDKCYENREGSHACLEEDALGGHDPYSSSKAAAEHAVSAYRRSFFQNEGLPAPLVATVRAGNVIGGGDWAADRIMPDAMRALASGAPIAVRNPHSTRPWQHVLEPLAGYLALAASLADARRGSHLERSRELASAFNFGPRVNSGRTVADLADEILKHHSGTWSAATEAGAAHEAGRLNLAIDKAFHLLGWEPVWGFERTVAETVRWYDSAQKIGARELTQRQIQGYIRDAADAGQSWAS